MASTANNSTSIKRVQFKQSVKMRLFTFPTETDIDNAWYKDEDYTSFKADRKFIRDMVKEMGREAIEDMAKRGAMTFRGLEHVVDKARAHEIRECRKAAYQVVSIKQRFVKRRGELIEQPDTVIAEGYAQVSKISTISAHARALADWSEERMSRAASSLAATPKNTEEVSSKNQQSPATMRQLIARKKEDSIRLISPMA